MPNPLKLIVFIALSLLSFASRGALIVSYLGAGDDTGVLAYHNAYPGGAPSHPQDAFQVFDFTNGYVGPEQLLDRSRVSSDSLGLVDVTASQALSVFAVSDTVNSDTSGPVWAEWQFDISGFQQLVLGLDMAAMGDFETSDVFSFSYGIDGAAATPLWQSSVNTIGSQSYAMASGDSEILDDPLLFSGTVLNNEFSRFEQALVGQGSSLTLRLEAKTDGGNEVFAFNKLTLEGEKVAMAPITSVPAPGGTWLLMASMLLALTRFKCGQQQTAG